MTWEWQIRIRPRPCLNSFFVAAMAPTILRAGVRRNEALLLCRWNRHLPGYWTGMTPGCLAPKMDLRRLFLTWRVQGWPMRPGMILDPGRFEVEKKRLGRCWAGAEHHFESDGCMMHRGRWPRACPRRQSSKVDDVSCVSTGEFEAWMTIQQVSLHEASHALQHTVTQALGRTSPIGSHPTFLQ